MNTSCNECGAGLAVPDDAIVGELVSCKDCSSEYEVAEISNGTALLKAAEKVGEDWGE
ncbi:MAG: lysine biosynthesis protein LysW [Nitrososphaerota archaeon]|nr:lysine biosynthesis protein LysW [Nitrososphaerota archaeon]MDG6903919.1 lysine biosynthesis protein LysW [Nitrososphaerota archaeon]MDG6919168.1 lysine biosynthesis protein LysW [Nitrososphaerota archaeon]MDG6920572.1 lysine biosynthesis protein LysW [Nitrososphaerota archaeon]MDG6924845.1 lysine biosynthesis protein LysW [Nitrososphaerota archaeon]